MKKNISLLLIIASIFTILTPSVFAATDKIVMINNHEISITQKQYNNLLSLGFTDYQIKSMEQEEFDANKNLTAEVVAKNSKYIKVLEYYDVDEYNAYYNEDGSVRAVRSSKNPPSPIKVEEVELTKEQYELESSVKSLPQRVTMDSNTRNGEIGEATVDTAYKTMQTAILKLGTGQYRARNDLVWTQMPANRGEDLLTTEVGTNVVPIDSTKYGKQIWTMCSGSSDCFDDNQVYSSTSSKWVNPDFYSRTLQPNLKDDEWIGLKHYNVTFLWIYMYYDLSKDYNGTINVLDAYGEYKHWRLDGYDSMPQTHAQATNVNW